MTTFSVIIAAYQAAETLPRALDSALAQTVAAHEIIVCDDGSTDHTPDVLAKYGGRISIVRQANGGVSAAKSAAGRMATGDWVVFLDADDEWMPTRLEKISKAIETNPAVEIVTTDAIVRSTDTPDHNWYDTTSWPDVDNQPEAIVGGSFIFGGAAVLRSAMERVSWFRTDLPHQGEWEAWVRLILGGGRAALVPEPLAIYHRHHGTGLSSHGLGTLRTMLTVIDEEAGRHGSAVDAAIGRSRANLLRKLYTSLGWRAVRQGDRAGCLRASASGHVPLRLRVKFAAASLFPAHAKHRLTSQ